MNAIRIFTRVESDTIRLPELKPLVGKDVEIIVLEDSRRPRGDLSAFFEAASDIPVDPDAIDELREASKLCRERCPS
ncbi:MAG: hypothetical protein WBF17_26060 [Phycisphaerae bacterium]